MTISREKYIKLMATAGVSLLLINTQLFNTQSPANNRPQVRSESETVDRATLLQDLFELDMKERRDLLGKVCSRYGKRLKVPLKLYNKKLRSVVDRLFI